MPFFLHTAGHLFFTSGAHSQPRYMGDTVIKMMDVKASLAPSLGSFSTLALQGLPVPLLIDEVLIVSLSVWMGAERPALGSDAPC